MSHLRATSSAQCGAVCVVGGRLYVPWIARRRDHTKRRPLGRRRDTAAGGSRRSARSDEHNEMCSLTPLCRDAGDRETGEEGRADGWIGAWGPASPSHLERRAGDRQPVAELLRPGGRQQRSH